MPLNEEMQAEPKDRKIEEVKNGAALVTFPQRRFGDEGTERMIPQLRAGG
jgi:hypothetical protein